MNPALFRLERYIADHEFSAAYLLCCSDAEPLLQRELLAMADPETLGLWRHLTLGYTESAGHPLLRHEIAGLYREASSGDVLVLAPEEGIFAAMNVLLGQGDQVVTTFPAYQSLYVVAEAIGCRVDRWIPRIEMGSWRFRVEDLDALLTPDARCS